MIAHGDNRKELEDAIRAVTLDFAEGLEAHRLASLPHGGANSDFIEVSGNEVADLARTRRVAALEATPWCILRAALTGQAVMP